MVNLKNGHSRQIDVFLIPRYCAASALHGVIFSDKPNRGFVAKAVTVVIYEIGLFFGIRVDQRVIVVAI